MELKKKVTRLENFNSTNSNVNHKQEIIEVQNKYLEALKEAQKSFEAYKINKEEQVISFLISISF